MREFKVIYQHDDGYEASYLAFGNENTTIDEVWASERVWFSDGAQVTIVDISTGDSVTYMQEDLV